MTLTNKIQMNMVGGGIQHSLCSSAESIPKYVEWKKDGSAKISIHIDDGVYIRTNKNHRNYLWLLESSAIISSIIRWVKNNISYVEENFELIFTHDRRLLSLSPKMRLVITNAVPWVKDHKIHEKSKLVSMIASTKRMCNGHLYRQQIAEKYKNQVDLFGTGRNRLANKEDGLRDYYFSIAMENDNYPDIFCEKITDCFAMGTIPIFWGTPTIGEFFNGEGIILLNDDFKIEDLSVDLYNSKIDAIKDNFERAINFPTAEDYFYEKYVK